MTEQSGASDGPRILSAGEGLVVGDPAGVRDRFMIDGKDADGRFALVQHLFGPKALAAPMHRHHKEDEYTFVLEGRIGAVLGGVEALAGPGDLIFKPRNQWHTFWNAGDEPASVLEFISPAGLEEFFRAIGTMPDLDPETLSELAARYQCDADMEATYPLVERHGLHF